MRNILYEHEIIILQSSSITDQIARLVILPENEFTFKSLTNRCIN